MPSTDDELDAMLEAGRPVMDARLAEDPRVSALLAEIGRGIADRPRLRTAGGGGRWRTVVAGAAAAAAVIMIPAVLVDRHDGRPDVRRSAAASPGGPALHTGRFERLQDGPDRDEWLNLESPELPDAIEEFGGEFPLPPGRDWSFLQRPGLWRGQMRESSFRHALAAQARCQWMAYWKVGGRTAAQKMLDRSREWSVYGDPAWTDRTRFDAMLRQLEEGDDRLLQEQLDGPCGVRSHFGETE